MTRKTLPRRKLGAPDVSRPLDPRVWRNERALGRNELWWMKLLYGLPVQSSEATPSASVEFSGTGCRGLEMSRATLP